MSVRGELLGRSCSGKGELLARVEARLTDVTLPTTLQVMEAMEILRATRASTAAAVSAAPHRN